MAAYVLDNFFSFLCFRFMNNKKKTGWSGQSVDLFGFQKCLMRCQYNSLIIFRQSRFFYPLFGKLLAKFLYI